MGKLGKVLNLRDRGTNDTVDGELRSLKGRDFIVIPVVALVEGVRHAGNAAHPELVPARAFGRYVGTWNGRPVVVDHPVNAEGYAIMAHDVEVLERSYLGEIMNAHIDDGKLLVEVWLDTEAIKVCSSDLVAEMWKRLTKGEVVEVSVGAIVETIEKEGKYLGKKYKGEWDRVYPDHLAFLSGNQIGACSIEDGCGTFRVQSVCNVRLSEKLRMAVRGKMKTVGSRALDGSDCSCTKPTEAETAKRVQLHSPMVSALFGRQTFDQDRRAVLSKALTKKYKGMYPGVVGFNDEVVIFAMWDKEASDYTLYKLDYESSDDDKVTLADADASEVMLQVKAVALSEDGEVEEELAADDDHADGDDGSAEETEDDDNEEEDEDMPKPVTFGKAKKATASKPPKPSNDETRHAAAAEALEPFETLAELREAIVDHPVIKQFDGVLEVAESWKKQCVTTILSTKFGKKTFKNEAGLADMSFKDLNVLATNLMEEEVGVGEGEGEEGEPGVEEEAPTGLTLYNPIHARFKGKGKQQNYSAAAGAPVQQKSKSGANGFAPEPPDVFKSLVGRGRGSRGDDDDGDDARE